MHIVAQKEVYAGITEIAYPVEYHDRTSRNFRLFIRHWAQFSFIGN